MSKSPKQLPNFHKKGKCKRRYNRFIKLLTVYRSTLNNKIEKFRWKLV